MRDLPRTIFDAISDVVWCTTEDGSLAFVNRAVESVYGRPVADFEADPELWLKVVHPDDHVIATATTTSLTTVGTATAEYRITRPDGSVRWIHDHKSIHRRGGEPPLVVGIARDITDQRAANEDARKSKALLEDVLNNVPDYIMRVDEEGRIGYINRTLPTLTIESVLGTPLFDYLHPDAATVVRRHLDRAYATGQIQDFEISGPGPLDEPAWYRCRQIPTVKDGAVTWVTYLATDITRAKQAEAREREARRIAEVANRTKGEFLANVSHEIRTPLTAILGFAEYAREAQRTSEERVTAVETIERNGRHLLCIINDVLDLAKIDSGEIDIATDACSPHDIVTGVLELCAPRANDKSLVLAGRTADDVPQSLCTDGTRLRQILVNLVDNAIKFTEHGEINVEMSTLAGGTQLCVAVQDTGIGMSSADMDRIFEPFVQADASSSRRSGGTGLGLAISRRLAKLLGGQLTVDSRQNRGSTFTLELPIHLSDPEGAARSQTSHTSHAGERVDLSGYRVLLAEDGDDNRRLLRFFLANAGADVEEACDGHEAVAAVTAGRDRFDAVLMDMQMPVMDGYEATTLLRQRGYQGPIIAVTAHAMRTDEAACLDAGCDAYVTKPIDRGELIATLAQAIRTRQPSTSE